MCLRHDRAGARSLRRLGDVTVSITSPRMRLVNGANLFADGRVMFEGDWGPC